MKPFAFAAAAIAATAFAAPVLAGPLDLARAHFAQSHETGDGPRVIQSFDADAATVERAYEIFAQSYETGDGPRYRAGDPINVTLSTSNSDLIRFANEKLYNDERGDN